jgi:hypothetical protein
MRAKTDEVLNIPADDIQRIESESSPAFSLDPFPVDQKGRKVLPDDIFMEHLSELPNNTKSESGLIAYNGGILRSLGTGVYSPEQEAEIRRAGAEALNAMHAQRRTLAETINILLKQKADPEEIETYGLNQGATKQDAMIAAIYQQATAGNVKAFTSLRDTVGEMPTIKQEVTADILTAEDRELLQKIRDRQQAERKTVHNPAEEPKQE